MIKEIYESALVSEINEAWSAAARAAAAAARKGRGRGLSARKKLGTAAFNKSFDQTASSYPKNAMYDVANWDRHLKGYLAKSRMRDKLRGNKSYDQIKRNPQYRKLSRNQRVGLLPYTS